MTGDKKIQQGLAQLLKGDYQTYTVRQAANISTRPGRGRGDDELAFFAITPC